VSTYRYKEDSEELSFIVGLFEEVANQQNAMNLYAAFPCFQKIWQKPMNKFIGSNKALLGYVNFVQTMENILKTFEKAFLKPFLTR